MSSRCRAEALLLVVLLAGCDLRAVGLAPEPVDEEEEPVEIDEEGKAKKTAVPGNKKGVVDLGTAVYPEGTPQKGAVSFTFSVPPQHRLGYAVSESEQRAIDAFYTAFAKSVKYKKSGDKSFEWAPPPSCPPDMSCVYRKLIQRTHDDVLPLARRFRARADAAKLNALQLTEIALAYVQNIPYEIPKDDPFGLKPPPLVVTEKKGDCDSKVLLLYMILNQLGIEAVILSSKAHRHTMLGVPLPTQGTTFRWNGRKYAFAETTAKHAPLGYLPPDLATPNDWTVELSPEQHPADVIKTK